MKRFTLLALSLTAFASQAHADGFVCQTTDGRLNVKIYNHVSPEKGTRRSAVLVLSDPTVNQGRKTIARFTDVKGTLTNTRASYLGNVDLRFNDTERAGEKILGTKLGELDVVAVDLGFSYAHSMVHGCAVEGTLTLVKRDGDEIRADLACTRYLKGE